MTQPTNSIDSEPVTNMAEKLAILMTNSTLPERIQIASLFLSEFYISRKVIEEALNNIADSVKQHTVPEGVGLVTRSYVLNTLEFERAKLLSPTKGGK